MPELPEVETVRRGLAPHLVGARIEAVDLRRSDLRFPFPTGFAETLRGATIAMAERRAKYLLFRLSSGHTWLSHLGMTGVYRFEQFAFKEPSRCYEPIAAEKHDHLLLDLVGADGVPRRLVYNDARRFGFMDLFAGDDSPFLSELGPEPLGNGFNATGLAARLRGKSAPMKAALLDQRIVAGLGNIYVSEALHRAHIRPDLPARDLVAPDGAPTPRLEALVVAIRAVLEEALVAGGSTLSDFRNVEGGSGYFQHRFAVYDREGEPCPTPGCGGTVRRIVQSGRSSFYCPDCQR